MAEKTKSATTTPKPRKTAAKKKAADTPSKSSEASSPCRTTTPEGASVIRRDTAVTSAPASDSIRTSGAPTFPVAPATMIMGATLPSAV